MSLKSSIVAAVSIFAISFDTPAVAADYLQLPAQSLEIQRGSVLDFSALHGNGAAGSEGWLQVDKAGKLSFSASGRAPRFGCASNQNGPHVTYDGMTREMADRYAEQLRRHGYNLVRFQTIDTRLMARRARDFDIDMAKLDQFQYLLAALKRNGIYWGIDLMTNVWGLSGNNESRPPSPDRVSIRSNFDPAAREHWLKIVDLIYARKNPYTGMSPLEDPTMAFVIGVNEGSVAFWSNSGLAAQTPFPTGMARYFNDWLARRYGNTQELAAELPDLGSGERVEERTVELPPGWSDTGKRMQIFMNFLSDSEVGTYRWMTSELQKRNFRGIVMGYQDWYRTLNNRTRSQLPVVDVHGYVGSVPTYVLGQKWDVHGSLDNDIGDYRALLANRWLDRPFTVTEYGHPFWNPFRYEAGAVFPALAAFQGVDLICRLGHNSIELDIPKPTPKSKPMLPFSIGLDPVARAGETLAMLLFTRGDVKAGEGAVVVPFGAEEMNILGSGNLPNGIRMGILLARFGMIPKAEDLPASRKNVVVPIRPTGVDKWSKILVRVVDAVSGSPAAKIGNLIAALRSNGVLSAANITDPGRKLYQSSTEQLTYDGANGFFQVITPKTEAIASMKPLAGKALKTITISSSTKSLVSASSMDDEPLAKSKKILLMLAGDARNSGMKFVDRNENALESWGTLPVMLERVKATVGIDALPGSKATLSVIGLNGAILRQNEVASPPGRPLAVELDTGAVEGNPTTFFLLERRP